MFTKKEMQMLFEKAGQQVKAVGIEPGTYMPQVVINTRAKKRWGQCKKRNGICYISVSDRLMQCKEEKPVLETMIHEILHTCKDCMNHGPHWKTKVNIMNNIYGYNIQRCSSEDDKDLPRTKDNESSKYVVECTGCHAFISRMKMSKVIVHPEYYRCAKCGGNLKRVV